MATNVCTAGVPLFKRRRLEGAGGPGKGPVIAEGATATSGVAWLAMPLLLVPQVVGGEKKAPALRTAAKTKRDRRSPLCAGAPVFLANLSPQSSRFEPHPSVFVARVGDCTLGVGTWKLGMGLWELEVGGWQAEVQTS